MPRMRTRMEKRMTKKSEYDEEDEEMASTSE
jgi:hypothetical protein